MANLQPVLGQQVDTAHLPEECGVQAQVRTHIQRHQTFYRAISILLLTGALLTCFAIAGKFWPKVGKCLITSSSLEKIGSSSFSLSGRLLDKLTPLFDFTSKFFTYETSSYVIRGAGYLTGLVPLVGSTIFGSLALIPAAAGSATLLSICGVSFLIPLAPGLLMLALSHLLWNAAKTS